MIRFCRALLSAALLYFFVSCTQDPLFLDIAREYPPIESIVKFGPTEIVRVGNFLHVANRTSVWQYSLAGNHRWEKMSSPVKYIKAIAATTDLYLLEESGGRIYKYTSGSGWALEVTVSGAQQIYGAGSGLFIGTDSTVYGLTSPNTAAQITGPAGLLTGAAEVSGVVYISLSGGAGSGVWDVSGASASPVYTDSVKGLIAASTTLIAVDNTGIIYLESGTFLRGYSNGGLTGGMAHWTDGTKNLLLLGLNKGYREIDLNPSGVPTSGAYDPGDNSGDRATSIDPYSKETSAIQKYPVNSMYVIPSPGPSSGDSANRPIVLASTQQHGLWSYRVRKGTAQWNGEDNSQ